MTRPASQWSNCFLLLFYLVVRGRVGRLVAVSTLNSWFPWHLVAISPNGHALHFQAEHPHDCNALAPWWFVGRLQGVRRTHLTSELAASGRVLCWSTASPAAVYSLTLGTAGLLLCPWLACWAVWPLLWFARSLTHAAAGRLARSGRFAGSRRGLFLRSPPTVSEPIVTLREVDSDSAGERPGSASNVSSKRDRRAA